jgi:hypothetical protein
VIRFGKPLGIVCATCGADSLGNDCIGNGSGFPAGAAAL